MRGARHPRRPRRDRRGFADRLALGVDGFTVNAVANGHIPGRVALLGETLRKVIGT